MIQIDDSFIGCDYADDICIIYGSKKIYYKRHILRAFDECKNKFLLLSRKAREILILLLFIRKLRIS